MNARRARATRRASVEDLSDLLSTPPHAIVAFVAGGDVHAAPVRTCRHGNGFLVGFRTGEITPPTGAVATLLVDEGVFTSELRGARLRGPVHEATCDTPDDGLIWFVLTPDHVVAWDYGRLRVRRR